MRFHVEFKWFCLYTVIWPLYDIRIDGLEQRCFRVRIRNWIWSK